MQQLHSLPDITAWLRARVSGGLQVDSRQVRPGDAFIAWPGAATDGRHFVADALEAGASAVLVEQEGVQAWSWQDERIATVPGLKSLTGPIASLFHGEPSRSLDMVAFTGTNGKTSSAWWMAQLLCAAGRPCAVVGTLGMGRPPVGESNGGATLTPTGLTTPDPVALQRELRRFVDEGDRACAIEASSIGLVEHRLAGCQVRVAVFTNLTQDHLDYHGDMERYWAAKLQLFDWSGLQAAVVNLDDPRGPSLLARVQQRGLDVWTVGIDRPDARLQAHSVSLTPDGFALRLREDGQDHVLCLPLVGRYNVSNLLGVIAAARALGISLSEAVGACARLSPVPGRMEAVHGQGSGQEPLVLVDYAHTPDALEQALLALQPLAQRRAGRLWVVVGCGGDRDPGKRPQMAAAAEARADQVVLTSDNPRSEDPLAILAQMRAGLRHPERVRLEVDRSRAIGLAAAQAQVADVVLVAGKGHEDYQEIQGVRRPFSDREEVRAALLRRHEARAGTASMNGLAGLLMQLPGARVVGSLPEGMQRVNTDTRSLQPGDLFVALQGERFDAHEFLAQARGQGALAAVAQRGLADAGLPGVEVPDTRLALGSLGRAWRGQFDMPLVAVTGSNGKTTVTQMVASILRAACGEAALATAGNFNNDIGVPLTLLRLRPHHRMAVVELGMNHPGEIAYLADLARPTVALVNNAQREHQEFMSSVEAVARENGSVISALTEQGCAVFPSDDAFSPVWMELAGHRRVLRFSDSDPLAEVRSLQADWVDGAWTLRIAIPGAELSCRLHIAGRHNVRNALAATACALAAGVAPASIVRGLEAFVPVGGRSRAHAMQLAGRDVILVDDSYNANPDSVLAAIDVLAELPGPRLLVLGDMGEVGEQGLAFHLEVLRHARARGIESVQLCGEWMRRATEAMGSAELPQATWWPDMPPMIDAICAALLAGGSAAPTSVLVKGSRFMKLERVVQAVLDLQAAAEQQEEDHTHAA